MAGIFGGNGYAMPYPQMYQQIQESNMLFVNGIQEASAWAVQPGKTAYLFDRNEDVFYVKTTDGLEVFDYKRRSVPQSASFDPDEYVRKSDFDALKKRIDDLSRHQNRKGRNNEQLSIQDVRES